MAEIKLKKTLSKLVDNDISLNKISAFDERSCDSYNIEEGKSYATLKLYTT
jgi:hypothetical protein